MNGLPKPKPPKLPLLLKGLVDVVRKVEVGPPLGSVVVVVNVLTLLPLKLFPRVCVVRNWDIAVLERNLASRDLHEIQRLYSPHTQTATGVGYREYFGTGGDECCRRCGAVVAITVAICHHEVCAPLWERLRWFVSIFPVT